MKLDKSISFSLYDTTSKMGIQNKMAEGIDEVDIIIAGGMYCLWEILR